MIQKINILDSSQSGVKNGADSEAVLAALIEHLELINPSGRLSQNTRSAMLQLREEEWSAFFFWLLNSLECLDYVIINLTPESKKTLMSEHRNNIQVAIDAYIANVGVNRRVMKVKHLPVEMTLSSATTYGKHLRNTSRQDLKNRLCRKNHSYGVICRQRHPEKPNDVVGVSAG